MCNNWGNCTSEFQLVDKRGNRSVKITKKWVESKSGARVKNNAGSSMQIMDCS